MNNELIIRKIKPKDNIAQVLFKQSIILQHVANFYFF